MADFYTHLPCPCLFETKFSTQHFFSVCAGTETKHYRERKLIPLYFKGSKHEQR